MGDGCHPDLRHLRPRGNRRGGDNTKLYLSAGNTLYWPNGAMTINPFRAYFQLNTATANARSIVLDFGDGTQTSIGHTEITDITEKADAIYDLQGRRVAQPTNACHTSTFRLKKGLYIVNGRKVVIK